MSDATGEMVRCPLLPEPGRHMVDDEFVITLRCLDRGEHADHYWSVEGHEHDDGYHECSRYCEGVEPSGGSA